MSQKKSGSKKSSGGQAKKPQAARNSGNYTQYDNYHGAKKPASVGKPASSGKPVTSGKPAAKPSSASANRAKSQQTKQPAQQQKAQSAAQKRPQQQSAKPVLSQKKPQGKPATKGTAAPARSASAAKKQPASKQSTAQKTAKQFAAQRAANGVKKPSSKQAGTAARQAHNPATAGARERRVVAGAATKVGSIKIDKKAEEAAALERLRKQREYNRNETLYKAIYFAAMAVAIVCGAFVLSITILFHIDNINVEIGENVPYSEEEILEFCGIETGENLLVINRARSAENIMVNLPYIEHCTVERKMPATVKITTEAAEILGVALNERGQRVVISKEGKALEVLHGTNLDNVPLINGMRLLEAEPGYKAVLERPEQFALATEVIDQFHDKGLTPDSIAFGSGNKMTAMYDGRISLKLGSNEALAGKLELAAQLISDGSITPNQAGILDLTIPGEAVFRADYLNTIGDTTLDVEYEQPVSYSDIY